MYLIRTSIIFTLLLFLSIYAPYSAFLNYEPHIKDKVIYIEKGDTINDVFSSFLPLNFANKLFLKIYSFTNDLDLFQSGEYEISNKSIRDIIYLIKSGETVTHKLKINEGLTIYDIENLINNSHLINDCSFLDCIDTNFSFKEGILYPDTYFYKKGMNASEILKESHNRLENFLNDKLKNKVTDTLLSKEEILILSSIIEKEAGNDQEKSTIASVFLKRLSIGMKLQADPTIIYGLLPNFDGDIKKSDILNKNNKYNTYMIYGLPPTPISISSISSINASIDSIPGEYLFFVADSPTSHYFSKTYEEHLNKINQLGLNK